MELDQVREEELEWVREEDCHYDDHDDPAVLHADPGAAPPAAGAAPHANSSRDFVASDQASVELKQAAADLTKDRLLFPKVRSFVRSPGQGRCPERDDDFVVDVRETSERLLMVDVWSKWRADPPRCQGGGIPNVAAARTWAK